MYHLSSWSIVYDTIYACQDREDDLKAGVKSTALLFGDYIRPILYMFSAAFITCVIVAGILNGNGVEYFVFSCGGAACFLVAQLATWDDNSREDNATKFKVSLQ